jgi:hypothetical protein
MKDELRKELAEEMEKIRKEEQISKSITEEL